MFVQHQKLFQIVTAADLKIVGIMRGSHLHATCTEFFIHVIISDHRDFTSGDRQDQFLTDQIAIAFIFRVHSHCHVAQHRFRTCGGHSHMTGAIGIGIADVPQLAAFIGVLNLVIGKRGHAAGAPIDDVFPLIDQAVFIEAHKYFFHRAGQHFVHGKAQPAPIAGSAQQP